MNKNRAIYYAVNLAAGGYFIYLSLMALAVGSDPGRLWRLSKIFLEGDVIGAFRSLEPFVPVTLNATMMGIGGLEFPITVVQGLASALILLLITNYIYQRHGLHASLITTMLFFFSYLFVDRSTNLIPYPLFLLLQSLGVLLYIKYRDTRKNIHLLLSALFFAYAAFTFNLALTAFSVVGFYGLLVVARERGANWRPELWTLLKFYGFTAVITAPWLFWRVGAAGIEFYQNPVTWIMEKYWSEFNVLLWHRPKPLSPEYFDYFLNIGIFSLAGSAIVLLFAIFGLFKAKHSLILFLWFIAPLYPLLFGKLPAQGRYIFSMLPPLIILASIGLYVMIKNFGPYARRTAYVGLVLLALVITIQNNENYSNGDHAKSLAAQTEINQIKPLLKPGQVVYMRSYAYQVLLPDNLMVSASHLSEQDAIALVTWPNDREVQRVLDMYDISWIILYRSGSLEKRFNAWVELADARLKPRHHDEIKRSPLFRQRLLTDNFVVYEARKQQ
jgi:hypothetical protein